MLNRNLSHIPAQALVPEQLTGYVTAVGQSRPVLCAGCVAYVFEDTATLVAYPPGSSPENCREEAMRVMDEAISKALALPGVRSLTVLSPAWPDSAPPDAASREDAYAFLALPLQPPGQNVRNMLRRAARECSIATELWKPEHAALVESYIASRPLEAGTRHIYRNIEAYLATSSDAVLFVARDAHARLLGMTIGDFTSLSTAFYMFAFRQADCPPGVADLLLHTLATEAEERGHTLLNLGLSVNKGISFFKKKWVPDISLPCVQTNWAIAAHTHSGQPPRRPAHERFPNTDDGNGPLAAFRQPTFVDNLKGFFRGNERQFDCLQIEVTSQCPGRCTYCPHTTKKSVWLSRRMEDATFAALLPVMREARRVHLQGWGEPLLHPRFFDFAAAARRIGCAVSTTSYGLAINDATAENLVRSGIDITAFSLTGVDEASNTAREGVPFARVCEAILAVNKAKHRIGSDTPHIHLAYLMLASQTDSVARLPALMAELDVPVAVVSTLDYIAAPDMEAEAYAPHETAKVQAARQLLGAVAEEARQKKRTIHYSLPGESGRDDCNEHVQRCMYIDAEGQISPCIYVNLPTRENDPHRRVYGCAREENPLAIWKNPAYAAFRNRLASGNPDLPCATCAKRFERIY